MYKLDLIVLIGCPLFYLLLFSLLHFIAVIPSLTPTIKPECNLPKFPLYLFNYSDTHIQTHKGYVLSLVKMRLYYLYFSAVEFLT